MEEKVEKEFRFKNPEWRQNPPKAPEPDKKIYAMKNGEIFLQEYVNIPMNDLGFTRGLTIFTVMEARENIIFHLEDHIERLRNSAISAYISSGEHDAQTWTILFRNKIKELLKRNDFKQSIVKIFMTGGVSENSFLPKGAPNTYITVEDKSAYPIKESAKLGVMVFERRFPQIKKTDDYYPAIIEMMNLERQGRKVDDVIYVKYVKTDFDVVYLKYVKTDFLEESYGLGKNYRISECSRANIFLLNRNNELITPFAYSVLPGVTRNIVLGLAKKRTDLRSVKEKEISFFDLTNPDIKEVFITSTTKGITPVILIDGSPGFTGKAKFEIGELTLSLKQDFNNYREEYFKNNGV